MKILLQKLKICVIIIELKKINALKKLATCKKLLQRRPPLAESGPQSVARPSLLSAIREEPCLRSGVRPVPVKDVESPMYSLREIRWYRGISVLSRLTWGVFYFKNNF